MSSPVPPLDGGLFTSIAAPEGRRYAAVFTCARGAQLNATSGSESFRSVGRALAVIHHACDRYAGFFVRPPLEAEDLLFRPLRKLIRWRPDRIQEIHEIARLCVELEDRITRLPKESPGFGICHGDVSPSNVHMEAGGQVEIFDFDLCGLGWRAYDLASFFWETEIAGWEETTRQAFLEGYESLRPLPDWEREAIPVLAATGSVTFLGLRAARAEEMGLDAVNDSLIDFHFARVRRAVADLSSPHAAPAIKPEPDG